MRKGGGGARMRVRAPGAEVRSRRPQVGCGCAPQGERMRRRRVGARARHWLGAEPSWGERRARARACPCAPTRQAGGGVRAQWKQKGAGPVCRQVGASTDTLYRPPPLRAAGRGRGLRAVGKGRGPCAGR